jgi:predicted nucleic acid-binding protein
MMTNNRFMLDTNVIISALLLPRSVARQAFDRAFEHGLLERSAYSTHVYRFLLACPYPQPNG